MSDIEKQIFEAQIAIKKLKEGFDDLQLKTEDDEDEEDEDEESDDDEDEDEESDDEESNKQQDDMTKYRDLDKTRIKRGALRHFTNRIYNYDKPKDCILQFDYDTYKYELTEDGFMTTNTKYMIYSNTYMPYTLHTDAKHQKKEEIFTYYRTNGTVKTIKNVNYDGSVCVNNRTISQFDETGRLLSKLYIENWSDGEDKFNVLVEFDKNDNPVMTSKIL